MIPKKVTPGVLVAALRLCRPRCCCLIMRALGSGARACEKLQLLQSQAVKLFVCSGCNDGVERVSRTSCRGCHSRAGRRNSGHELTSKSVRHQWTKNSWVFVSHMLHSGGSPNGLGGLRMTNGQDGAPRCGIGANVAYRLLETAAAGWMTFDRNCRLVCCRLSPAEMPAEPSAACEGE